MKSIYWLMIFLTICTIVIISCATTHRLQKNEYAIYTSDQKILYKKISPVSLDESDRITITIDSVDVSFILPGEGWKKKIIPATDSTLEVHQFYSSTWPDSGLFIEIALDEGLVDFKAEGIHLRLYELIKYGPQFTLNTVENLEKLEQLLNEGPDSTLANAPVLIIKGERYGGLSIIFYEKEELTNSGEQKYIYLDSAIGSFGVIGRRNKHGYELLFRIKCPYIQFYNGLDKIMMGIWKSIMIPGVYVKVEG